jgi:hypothetical protein
MTRKELYLKLEGKRIKSDGYEATLVVKQYANGRLAIQAICDDGIPLATLTVNIPAAKLKRDEIFVKTWAENAEFSKNMLATGLFDDTGRREPTGFVEAQVWKVR